MTRKQAQAKQELEQQFIDGDERTRGLIITALVHSQSVDLLKLRRWSAHHRQMAAQLLDWADDPRTAQWRQHMTRIEELRARYISTAPKQRKQVDDGDGLDMDVWGDAINGLEW